MASSIIVIGIGPGSSISDFLTLGLVSRSTDKTAPPDRILSVLGSGRSVYATRSSRSLSIGVSDRRISVDD